jgi:GNAT superfamily N-acetyltransferase
VSIRRAGPADAGEVLTVQRAAWVSEAWLHGTVDLPPLRQTLDGVLADLERQVALVAVDGHRIVGIVRASADAGRWHIGRLGVVPDRQGEGIGRSLLIAIEAEAPDDVHTFALFTGPHSRDNVAFYERAGYCTVPSTDGLIHLHKPRRPDVARA